MTKHARSFRPSLDHLFPLWCVFSCALYLIWEHLLPQASMSLARTFGWMVIFVGCAGWLSSWLRPRPQRALWASYDNKVQRLVCWAGGSLALLGSLTFLGVGLDVWGFLLLLVWALCAWSTHLKELVLLTPHGLWLLGRSVERVPLSEIWGYERVSPHQLEVFDRQGYMYAVTVELPARLDDLLAVLTQHGIAPEPDTHKDTSADTHSDDAEELAASGEERAKKTLWHRPRRALWRTLLYWAGLLGAAVWLWRDESLAMWDLWSRLTLQNILMFGMFAWTSVLLSECPPRLLPPKGKIYLEDNNARGLYVWGLLPVALGVILYEGYVLWGLWSAGSYDWLASFTALFCLNVAFTALYDGTNIHAWISVTPEGLWRRYTGWREFVLWADVSYGVYKDGTLRLFRGEDEYFELPLYTDVDILEEIGNHIELQRH
ncbi:MAG TPA: hypothetical protein DCE42_27365 [Myxococcales bacterium]|nr:hypothetical protein [Deltaproteobacteria bacterium]MBU49683.1 hypothetical protein [Deltaproteobacteria bacterium]HAA58512.1 hypothetical protein [Myxococcales bacterium]